MRIHLRFVCILSVLYQVNGFMRNKRHLELLPRPEPDPEDNVVAFDIMQIVDHESDTMNYWHQRAWSNNRFVKDISTAPFFLFIFGEGPADPSWLTSAAWYEWGRDHNAMLFGLEHRYYGESHPTPDTSPENLKYLTSKQALADIANFIDAMNQQYVTQDRKWIVFGGSYPGMLAAWSRLHYPDKILGAVSSSAPLQAKEDFTEYIDVLRDAVGSYSQDCSDFISQVAREVKQKLTDEDGKKEVLDTFQLCGSSLATGSWKELYMFYGIIFGDIGGAVQDNIGGNFTIKDVCDMYMLNETIGTPMQRLAAMTNREKQTDDSESEEFSNDDDDDSDCKDNSYDDDDDSDCYKFSYDDGVDSDKDNDWKSDKSKSGNRQWHYQTCNEFGFFMTSHSEDSFYGDTIKPEYMERECTDVFGEKYNADSIKKAVNAVNERNQGKDINVTNVVFIHGGLDPWHPLGMVQSTEESPLIVMEGMSHCVDMDAPDDDDPPVVTAAREKAGEYLKKWLNDGDDD